MDASLLKEEKKKKLGSDKYDYEFTIKKKSDFLAQALLTSIAALACCANNNHTIVANNIVQEITFALHHPAVKYIPCGQLFVCNFLRAHICSRQHV